MIHKDRAWARRQKGDSLSHQPLPHIHFSLAACPAQSQSMDLWGHPAHSGRHPLGCQLVYTFPDGPGSATLPPPRPPPTWACRRHDRNKAVRAAEMAFPQEKAAKAPCHQPGRRPSPFCGRAEWRRLTFAQVNPRTLLPSAVPCGENATVTEYRLS